MNHSKPPDPTSIQTPFLRYFSAEAHDPTSLRWRINGYPARLLIWSWEEWEKLPERPADAQLHPLGLWCALRLD